MNDINLKEGLNRIKLSNNVDLTIYLKEGYTFVEVRDHSDSLGLCEPQPLKASSEKYEEPQFTTNTVGYEIPIKGSYLAMEIIRFLK